MTTRTVDRLPDYLKQHCSEQDYAKYTPVDHAAWRYIMRRAAPFFRKHAVKTYEEGLRKTAIPLDRIPNIDEMDRKMQEFGWGAVPVCGFIPPWAFLEFQARKILPIATDMRTVEHIGYTPAPDIVHEAAGHAPILPDLDYSNYLSHYAELGTQAIYSDQDLRVFEAVRVLSDIKENPDSTADEIAAAEMALDKAGRAVTYVSEASRVARMSWWTAEYGLVGDVKNPRIYGAGLLSSVAESLNCLTKDVKKIPFSIDCINYSYNITQQQPQLFVCSSMQELIDVLHELDDLLAYRRGGKMALDLAKECKAVTTTMLDSGIAVSGKLVDYMARGETIDFMRWEGAVQLTSNREELEGQGARRHPQGFSSPIGRWVGASKHPRDLSDTELQTLGLRQGQHSVLTFESGIVVKGEISKFYRQAGKLLYITWKNCTVTHHTRTLYQPEWGEFDMVVGIDIPGVAGGPADRNTYSEHEDTTSIQTSPGRKKPFSAQEKALFSLYGRIRDLRQPAQLNAMAHDLPKISEELIWNHGNEWLAMLECYEAAREQLKLNDDTPWVRGLHHALTRASDKLSEDTHDLIRHGLEVIDRNLHPH